MRNFMLLPLVVLITTGCASMSGYDAKDDFSCSAPKGVSCSSVSGIYANARAGTLPSQNPERDSHVPGESMEVNEEGYNHETHTIIHNEKPVSYKRFHGREVAGDAPHAKEVVYKDPKVLRIWFSPWEDKDGLLHDQSFIYTVVQKGRWGVEHIKAQLKTDSKKYVKLGE